MELQRLNCSGDRPAIDGRISAAGHVTQRRARIEWHVVDPDFSASLA